MTVSFDLWVNAGKETEDALLAQREALAVEALSDVFAFTKTTSRSDFANRMALVEDRIDKVVASVTEGDPAGFAVLRARVAELIERKSLQVTSKKVEVYLNETVDEDGRPTGFFMGYREGDTMRLAISYEDDGDDMEIAERAFKEFNIGSGPLAQEYRAGRNRSLSVGDLVKIDGVAYSVEPFGWERRAKKAAQSTAPERRTVNGMTFLVWPYYDRAGKTVYQHGGLVKHPECGAQISYESLGPMESYMERHSTPGAFGACRLLSEAKKAMRKGAPFAGYESFEACVAANQDKDDPEAYCGSIKHKVEDSKESKRKTSAFTDLPKEKGVVAEIDGFKFIEMSGPFARYITVGDVRQIAAENVYDAAMQLYDMGKIDRETLRRWQDEGKLAKRKTALTDADFEMRELEDAARDQARTLGRTPFDPAVHGPLLRPFVEQAVYSMTSVFESVTDAADDYNFAADENAHAFAFDVAQAYERELRLQGLARRKTAAVSRSDAEKVLKAVEQAFASYVEGSGYRPTLDMNWDFMGTGAMAAIHWEEGPYDWAYEFPYGGIDQEFGYKIPDVSASIPGGVFIEPITSWAIGLYPNTTASRKARRKTALVGDWREFTLYGHRHWGLRDAEGFDIGEVIDQGNHYAWATFDEGDSRAAEGTAPTLEEAQRQVELHAIPFPGQDPLPFAARKTASKRYETAKAVVESNQAQKIEGTTLDTTSAQALITVYEALSADNQAKFDSIPLDKLMEFVWSKVSHRIARQRGARKMAASDWTEFLDVVDYNHDFIPTGERGFWLKDPYGRRVHDTPFKTREEAVAWAKKNWKKAIPTTSSKTASDPYSFWATIPGTAGIAPGFEDKTYKPYKYHGGEPRNWGVVTDPDDLDNGWMAERLTAEEAFELANRWNANPMLAPDHSQFHDPTMFGLIGRRQSRLD